MTAPATSHAPDAVERESRKGHDHMLSPEDVEELEFFRKMAKLSQEAAGRELQRLIRPE